LRAEICGIVVVVMASAMAMRIVFVCHKIRSDVLGFVWMTLCPS